MVVVRALFRALLPSFVGRGLSATAMIREAKAIGVLTYRRQDMLADIREFQGFFRRESLVRKWSQNILPHHGLMTEISLRRDRRYRIFSNVTLQNTISGETETKTVSYYSDELKTMDDWQDDYKSAIEAGGSTPEYELVSITTRAIEHNAGWRY